MPQSTKCPKCGSSMEKGVIPDQGHGRVFVNHWQLGREIGWFGGLRSRNQTRYEIAAYRCTKCGFLEQYATEPKSW